MIDVYGSFNGENRESALPGKLIHYLHVNYIQ